MFESIVIKYNKHYHTLGNIIECLLFYDNVNLIVDKIEDLPSLWTRIGIDGLIRLKNYGLYLYMSTSTIGCGGITGKGEDVYYLQLSGESMRHRICEKAVKEFYETETLDSEKQKIVQLYHDASEDFSYSERARQAMHDDIYQHFVHKDILQAQLKEIGSPLSMFDPHNKYEFRKVSNGFVFNTTLLTGELEEQARRKGYVDMRFKHATFLIKLTELYGVMDLAADKNSALCVTPAESIIVSCKQKDILQRYSEEHTQIENFEKLEVSSFASIAEVVDSGEKSIDDICELLDCAQEFKDWKRSLSNESDFLVEYQKALQSNLPWVQRLPIKWTRLILTSGIGLIPLVGSVLGPVASGLDTFLIDKWQAGGWKPAQFVNGELKRFVSEMKKDETR